MKFSFTVFINILLIFLTVSVFAQENFDDHYNSIESNVGFVHYFGDLSPDGKFGIDAGQGGFSLGVGVSRQVWPRIGIRANTFWARLKGDDTKSFDPSHPNYRRGLHFNNDIFEGSATAQLYLFKAKGHYSNRPLWSPYIFAGFSAIYHNPKAKSPPQFGAVWTPLKKLRTEGQSEPYSNFTWSIPYGFGMNFRVTEQIDLGIEIGFRTAFTDNLDDVSGNYVGDVFDDNELAYYFSDPTRSFEAGKKRGDGSDKDGFILSSFKLKYILFKNKKLEELSRLHRVNDININNTISLKDSGTDFYKYQDRYSIENLAINSEYSEMQPSFYQGGIMFVSDNNNRKLFKKGSKSARHNMFNFFYAPVHDIYRNELTKPIEIQDEKYKRYHHFTGVQTDKGQKVLLAMYEKQDGDSKTNTQKLFEAEIAGENVWINVEELPFSSDGFSIAHPTVSADGSVIYFSSDKKGGLGGTDIYVSYKYKGNWTYPINVGAPVNTPGNEMFPFIHQDGNLYFASDGHESMGGLDIYEAISKGETFERVANLGAPINSVSDDFGLILDDVKRIGFFTSNREGGKGGDDIYRLNVESINRSRKLTDDSDALFSIMKLKLKGKVINKDTGLPISKAIVKLRDVLNDDLKLSRTNAYGEFSFTISNDAIYEVGSTIRGFHPMNNKKLSTVGIAEREDVELTLEAMPLTYRIVIKGVVKNKVGEQVLPNAEVVVLDLREDTQDAIIADENGKYQVTLKSNRNYILFISEKGFKPKEINISTYNRRSSETRLMDIALEVKE